MARGRFHARQSHSSRNGGKLIADYGAFQIIQADDTALTNLDASRMENEDEYDAIKLNAARLDTRAAEIQALRRPARRVCRQTPASRPIRRAGQTGVARGTGKNRHTHRQLHS
jgi:hypothetical protein